MERKYTILSILLIVMALGLVILPKKDDKKEMDSKILLSMIAEKSRYLNEDQVTHRIIENDPTLLLIDLRPADQYKKFALPGSINLSPDSLLSKSTIELFKQPGKDKILYAESDQISQNVWLVFSRYAVSRMYVMKGGMTEWSNTILKEQIPSATASTADLDLISFRKAARQYFTGEGSVTSTPISSRPAEKIQVVRKAPAATSGGGC
ncbi:MAG: rhodanese-like domain-containing protein [Prolixibacteraceae bacterium]